MTEITAFRLESNFPPMRALEFIRDHVTFKLPYDFSYHMKTPKIKCKLSKSQIRWTQGLYLSSILHWHHWHLQWSNHDSNTPMHHLEHYMDNLISLGFQWMIYSHIQFQDRQLVQSANHQVLPHCSTEHCCCLSALYLPSHSSSFAFQSSKFTFSSMSDVLV